MIIEKAFTQNPGPLCLLKTGCPNQNRTNDLSALTLQHHANKQQQQITAVCNIPNTYSLSVTPLKYKEQRIQHIY